MKYKKTIYSILSSSALGFVIGFFLSDHRVLKWCREYGACNTEILGEYIGVPLLLFSVVFFLLSIIFFFLHEEIFHSWAKFAKIYLPMAAFLIIISAFSNQDGGWGVGADFDSELTTWWLAGIFFVASIGIIAWQSWKLRKNRG